MPFAAKFVLGEALFPKVDSHIFAKEVFASPTPVLAKMWNDVVYII